MQYRGRFAPSPTGPLHFGSLIAAVGSYLQARSQQGVWLVRVEDLDPLREIPGTTKLILDTLEAYGFQWDEEITYQSARTDLYANALNLLQEQELTYPCTCSRKQLRASVHLSTTESASDSSTKSSNGDLIYPGTCRTTSFPINQQHSIRIKTDNHLISFDDRIQGNYSQKLESEIGDFIIKRSDGQHAYQLAVVVDDAEQQITEIVRGSDLLDNTPRQLYLQHVLKLGSPEYMHLPVAADQRGIKLSKQTHAKPVDLKEAVPTLWRTLAFLGQKPPEELLGSDLSSFWTWAVQNWDPVKIRRVMSIQETTL